MRHKIVLVSITLLLSLAVPASAHGQVKPKSFGDSGTLRDPDTLFDFLAKGRAYFLVTETRRYREPLKQFLKERGIAGDQVTRAVFSAFAAQLTLRWGSIIDPDGDCKFSGDKKKLTILVPKIHHDLTYTDDCTKLNAPRVLRDARGDFRLAVKVPAFPLPAANTSSGGRFSFVSAGLLLWQDEKNFVRMDRAAEGAAPSPFVWVERFQNGAGVSRKLQRIDNTATNLRVIREGHRLTFQVSGDGKDWREVHALEVKMPELLRVGVAAINTTTSEVAAVFEELDFQPAAGEKRDQPADAAQPSSRSVRRIEGWKVRVDDRLLRAPHEEVGKKALRFLESKLYDITVVVPEDRVAKLRAVTIVLDLTHGKLTAMQYHPSAGWLRAHGYSADLAKCVHLPRAADLPTKRNINEQPWVILHELAHAYHDQVLGFDHPRVREAFANYKKSGRGEKTLLYNGKRVRHYALTDEKEFFAEMSEAYFGVNDFFPFARAELRESEPDIYSLLREIWEAPQESD